MRWILTLALVVGASAPLPAAEPKPTSPVTLDVVVEDNRGRAIENLNASDFSVIEQTRSLSVNAIRFVRAPVSGSAVQPVSTASGDAHPSGDVIAIYLDEFHVTPGPAADAVRDALMRFVNDDTGSADQVVVLKSLDSLLEIRPSKDRAEAMAKIGSFDPRRGEYEPRTAFERNFIAGTPARVEAARAQIVTSSLEALATELGRLGTGRKTLIVVSEGFSRSRRRGDDLLPSLESVVMAANRGSVAIYPFNPAGDLETAPQADGATDDGADIKRRREALQALADGTSGRPIASGDVAAGLRRAAADSRGYYELTLAGDLARDGRFHSVEVTVRRPGVIVRARKGYWLASDEEPSWRSTLAAATAIPRGALIARRVSPLIRPWFGISMTADGQTEVSFVWEPAPRVPGDRNPPPPLAQVGISVMTLEGKPVFDGVVLPLTSATADPALARQSRASFVSPSGRLVVQMSIEDVTARVVDHDVRDLEVRGFQGPVSMGSPQVLRARTAREFQTLAADPEATPVASRQFSRSERLLVRIPVFAIAGSPNVTARLVSGYGSAMRDLTVSRTPTSASDYQVDVPLAALANGSYVVEWTARTADGEVRERVPFRVTP